MLRNAFIVIFLVIFLIAPLIAAGQDVPSGKWWYNPKIQKNTANLFISHLLSLLYTNSLCFYKIRAKSVNHSQFPIFV